MNESWRERFEIISYKPRYRQILRDICAATAWQGMPAPRLIGDEWIWAEVWTRYFTDRETEHSYVVRERNSGDVVGYLTGTMNARRVERFFPWLLLGIVGRVVRGRLLRGAEARRALLRMARSHILGELDLPAWVRDRYPATWHFNLLPAARGGGIGRALFDRFLADVREHRVRGIHAQTLSRNEGVARFLVSMGFRLIQVRPATCLAHAGLGDVAIHTWVREVDARWDGRRIGRWALRVRPG